MEIKNIVMIPGIMGTRLRKDKRTVWPLASIHNAHRELIYESNLDLDPYECLRLYYKRMEKYLSEKNFNVYVFPYDWRKNNLDQLELLKAKVNTFDGDFAIVAHSMGGIIAKLFVNYFEDEPDLVSRIKKVITLGTPWNGAPYAYKAIKYGVNIPEWFPMIMTALTSKKIAPGFASLYQLLPREKYTQLAQKYGKMHFLEFEGTPIESWDQIQDEYYVPLIKRNFSDTAYSKIILEFEELLLKEFTIDHHEVIGYGKKTIYTVKENSYNEPENHFDNGDGTVPIISAMSDNSIKYFICENHNGLAKNWNVLDLVENILNTVSDPISDSSVIKSDYEEVKDASFSGNVIKVACPVTVSLSDENGNIIYGSIEILDDEDIEELFSEKYEVSTIENTTYIFVNEEILTSNNPNRKVIIEAYDSGPTSVSIEKYENGNVKKITTFDTFNINPNINAELKIVNDFIDSQIILSETGKDDVLLVPNIIDLEEKDEIILPKTVFNITADDVIVPEKYPNSIVVSENVVLTSEGVEKGSYSINGTFYSINGNSFKLISPGESIPLKLLTGINEMVLFSKDSLGNVEEKKIINIYKVTDRDPIISFEFYPHMYKLLISDNNDLVYENLGIPRAVSEVKFDNNDKVFGEDILYIDKQRVISINITNIFGRATPFELTVDENAIKTIFEGEGDHNNLKEFLELLKITQPYDQIMMHKHAGRGGGVLRKLTKANIQNAKHIFVRKNNLKVDVYKGIEFFISFQNFTQDIIIKEEENYPFEFIVIDLESKNEIRSKEFSAFVKAEFHEEFISEEINIVFDDDSKSYKGNFIVSELKDFLKDYWKPDSLEDIELVIQERGTVIQEVTTEKIIIR
ncbi:hypothetical protein BK120_14890 [Paenibacillus sp. FSL A5-0031]|uniref:lipase/acyltransferase domain-containing protein n=1 Tax=Paenibacillus sp. FSL A5-0031 TaxID=1920420 RepID=UPI00096F928D|nr:hypothetical protein [Paenibacillus sp. FSL A5-0031]OME83086.1 hypothetical protein BK120_14890 [Paenibacillus sp. FSL A5-0031]